MQPAMSFERKRIGEILVEMGVITPAEVDLILAQMATQGKRFGETGDSRLFRRRVLAQALARRFQLEYIDLDHFDPDPELMLPCRPVCRCGSIFSPSAGKMTAW